MPKDLKVVIDGDAAKLEREMTKVAASVAKADAAMAKAHTQATKLDSAFEQMKTDKAHAGMDKLGRGMLAFGAAAAAGLALAAKAAIDWESAFAGVRKTVDGSDAEIASLEAELRGLAKTLPATHGEIAAVAEAAGQLGIKRQDVAAFTKTMVDLGETTNLSADEAATAIAQMANIMGTSVADVDNMGSAIVELGNNGASTEKDIIQMGLRIASTGKVIGLSEADVLAFASALSSVGIEAEAGGTAISRVMTDMAQSVRRGGSELELLAKVAGVSAGDFQRAFQEDAGGAIASFVEGLGDMQASGGDLFSVLNDLGWDDVRVKNSLLALAGSGDLLRESLTTAGTAWQSSTALAEEAAKRYETSGAQIEIAWNNIKDAAITAGGTILPILADVAGGVADLASWFGDLPAPVQQAFAMLGALAAVLGTVGGAALLMIPRIVDTVTAIRDIQAGAPRAAAALRGLSLAAAGLSVLVIAGAALKSLQAATDDSLPGLEALTSRLLDLANASVSATLGTEFDDLARSIDLVNTAGLQGGLDKFAGAIGVQRKEVRQAKADLEALDGAFAALVSSGHQEQATASFEALTEQYGLSKAQAAQLIEQMPQYQEALAGVANEARLTAEAETGVAAAGGLAVQSFEEQQKELEALKSAYFDTANAILGLSDANIGFEAAIDDATAALEANGQTLAITEEKGRANKTSLDNIARSALGVMQQLYDTKASQEELAAATDTARSSLYNAAVAFGMTEAEASAYVDQVLKVPPKVDTTATFKTQGMTELQAAKALIDSIPSSKTITVQGLIATSATQAAAYAARLASGNAEGGVIGKPHAAGGPIGVMGGSFILPNRAAGDDQVISAQTGEFMVNRAAAAAWRPWLEAINSGRAMKGDPSWARSLGAGGGTTHTDARTYQLVGENRSLLRALQRMEERDRAARQYSEV